MLARLPNLLIVILLSGPAMAWQGRVHKVEGNSVIVYSPEATKIAPGRPIVFMRAGKVIAEGEVLEVLHTQVRVRLLRGTVEKNLVASDFIPGPNEASSAADLALLSAVERDDETGVIYALKGGANAAAKSQNGRPGIMIATANGNAAIIRRLLAARADINAPGIWGETAVMVAVQNRNSKIVQLLVRAGADLAIRDASGATVLCLAVRYGSEDLVRFLVTSGADPNLPNSSGETPLWLATEQDRPEIASLLIGLGARLNEKNNAGLTPLAVARRRNQPTLIQILESAGAKD